MSKCPIKSICIGNNLIFGALGSKRVYLCDPRKNIKIARTQLEATDIYKDLNSDTFVTSDTEGTVHEITFDNLKDDDNEDTNGRLQNLKANSFSKIFINHSCFLALAFTHYLCACRFFELY